MPSSFNWREPQTFSKGFDAYYQDNFGWRASLIEAHARFKIISRVSPTEKVVIGSNGWLFYTGDKVMDNYQRLRPYKEHQLRRIKDYLEAKRDWLAAKGVQYLYVVAPDKHSIYPEYIPDRISTIPAPSRLDQLISYLAEHSDIKIVDFRQDMKVAKSDKRVYHKTDTHWNLHGARIGYEAIALRLQLLFPGFTIREKERYMTRWELGSQGDMGKMIGIDGLYHETRVNYLPDDGGCGRQLAPEISSEHFDDKGVHIAAVGCADGQLNAVFFGDSYRNLLLKFAEQDFKRVDHINRRFNLEAMQAYISNRKPDVVIEMYVERMMGAVVPQATIDKLLVDVETN